MLIDPFSLTRSDLVEIVDIQLARVAELLRERSLKLEVDASAREYLAEIGYDPDFGARPLKRTIQREVQDPLAIKVVSGEIGEGDTVRITRGKDGLQFEIDHAPLDEPEAEAVAA